MTGCGAALTDSPSVSNLQILMGQQSNKVQKRRRRLDYIERKKVTAKEAAVTRAPKKKSAPRKKEAVPATE